VTLYETVTLSPSSTATATANVSISPDGSTWTQVGIVTIPSNAGAWSGFVYQVLAQLPPGWYYKFSATNASLGTLVAIG
jgi:hypothetical protein